MALRDSLKSSPIILCRKGVFEMEKKKKPEKKPASLSTSRAGRGGTAAAMVKPTTQAAPRRVIMPEKRNRVLANIKVVGVGGAGGNVITRMQSEPIKSVEFIAVNTDSQDLDCCTAHKKLYIGRNVTRGLGAGMNPEMGRQAAEESRQEIVDALTGADLVFIAAGTGGGTGSSASIVVAEVAKELGALTIAVVTKPFAFEGGQRTRIANDAIVKLREKVDSIIVIPNDRIFNIINKETSIMKAFEAIDEVLKNAVLGIAELITMPGIVNVDFADVKAIMQGAGPAIVGIGIASGKDRAAVAVNQAVNSPLLETTMDGARGVLFSVSGSRDLKMSEIHDVAKSITDAADPSAKVIFGAYHDRKLRKGVLKVTMIAVNFTDQSGVKRPDSLVTNLFGERISSREYGTESVLFSQPERDPKGKGREKQPTEDPFMNGRDVAAPHATAKPPSAHTTPSALRSVPMQKKEEKKEDFWDIPAFLRRKKK